MITENINRVRRIKRLFYFGAALWAVSSLLFFLVDEDVYGFIAAVILVVWFLVFQYIDFQYIGFDISNGKLTLRYYPVVKFGQKEYSTIEFPVQTLMDYRLEKSVFGLVNDLILVIRTKKGVAEYPSVSLAAVNKQEWQHIENQIRTLLNRS